MNKFLFKFSFKDNYKLIIIAFLILTLYISIIVNMYDPLGSDIMQSLMDAKLSESLLEAFGFSITSNSLIEFLTTYLYGFILLLFPMIFYIIISSKLVSSLVDSNKMINLLNSPFKRSNILITQMVVVILSVFSLVIFSSLLMFVLCEFQFSGLLDINKFFVLNVGLLLIHLLMCSISFLASTIFNDKSNAILFGSIPVLFLIIQFLYNASNLEVLKYFTLFSLFNPINILNNEFIFSYVIMFLIALFNFLLSIFIFNKKDLYI
ncbi:MAG: ABC transporter permease subunit [Mycoplasmatota bacterium]